jgi:hypothetical protein
MFKRKEKTEFHADVQHFQLEKLYHNFFIT